MANEATKVENSNNYEQHDFTVADGAGIEKGTIMELSDPRTAAANNGSGDVFAGIAAAEKVASDGQTNLSCYTRGIFLLTNAPTAISAGQIVSTSGANLIKTATEAEVNAGKGIGKTLQDFAAGGETGEVFVGQF